ncbi:hypothetical protein FHG08_05930 [Pseudoalteromonas sp. Scap03]|uniref:hypothetical protein n=1 Tax=unclassified Pseudoalteromonas TaxID=194690 RepID=UPI0015B9A432|nr:MULTISPECIES: hypothetical protein [unclassified Pseudoalteromonas]NWL15267.1 hypothetical protein [Pseudoalteromonas sp. Scap03]QLE80419.1 hypothetical protein FLM54_02195 [Pseudoalteromonas sp. Scap25]QLE88362.1 hypothetical protein FLM47_02195 [Pseudoalteromonas sp. Scap06]
MFLNVNSIKQRIRGLLKSLWRFVGYYDGNFYQFVYTEQEGLTLEPIKNKKKPKILIISCGSYAEEHMSLPVVDKKELRQLLKLQTEVNQATLVCEIQSDKSIVNRWQLPDFKYHPFFIIPESVLITKKCRESEALVVEEGVNSTIFALIGKVTYSGQLKGVINTAKRFAMSVGMQLETTTTLSQKGKLARFESGIKQLTFKELVAFTSLKAKADKSKLLVSLSLPAVAIVSAYLLVSSLFLILKTEYLDYQTSTIEQQLGELLRLQSEVEEQQASYLSYIEILNNQTDYTGLLVSLIPVFEQVRLTSVIYENGRYIVRGEIEKASDFLDLIAAEPNVDDAKFDFAVIKSRARERFVISFKLAEKLIIPENEEPTLEEPEQNG